MEKTQEQARREILDLVADYCRTYHINNKKPYKPGDRIPYASRVYDEAEMVNLVDSALEFWLTIPMSLRRSWLSIWACATAPW